MFDLKLQFAHVLTSESLIANVQWILFSDIVEAFHHPFTHRSQVGNWYIFFSNIQDKNTSKQMQYHLNSPLGSVSPLDERMKEDRLNLQWFASIKKYYFETYREIIFLRSLSNDDCRLKTHICFVPNRTWFSSESRLIKSGNKTKIISQGGRGG